MSRKRGEISNETKTSDFVRDLVIVIPVCIRKRSAARQLEIEGGDSIPFDSRCRATFFPSPPPVELILRYFRCPADWNLVSRDRCDIEAYFLSMIDFLFFLWEFSEKSSFRKLFWNRILGLDLLLSIFLRRIFRESLIRKWNIFYVFYFPRI